MSGPIDRTADPAAGAVSPLSVPIFRAVWVASIASNFGGLIQSVGASWMMTDLSGAPAMVALVQASTTLPIMLLSLLAGACADSFDRRRIMLAAQLFMLCLSVVLVVTAWAGLLTPWLLLGFTFMIACGAAFNGPAWQSAVGEMVPRAALPGAVALNSMGFNIARSIGPALGGAIVAAFGAAAAFATNVLSYCGLILVLARWHPPRREGLLPRERLPVAMAAGLRYAAMSPNIRTLLVRSLLVGFALSAIPALAPLVARDLLGGQALTYGLLLGGFGVGAVAGALASGRLRARFGAETIVRGALALSASGTAGLAVSRGLPASIAAMALAGVGWVLALSTFNTVLQLSTPRWVVARMLALYQMAAFGGMALGSWTWGELAGVRGVHLALGAGAAAIALALAAGVRLAIVFDQALDMDPIGRWREPETAVPVEPRSGPVVVSSEYRIAAADVPRFLAAMAERRRIRRRDGARHWALLRDLGESDLWIERYMTPTWLDYVRHNQRRTHADLANWETLVALNGGEPPVVRRRIERQTGSIPVRSTVVAEPLTDPTRAT